jgi:peptidyl-prolyl cis-trans isomerase C
MMTLSRCAFFSAFLMSILLFGTSPLSAGDPDPERVIARVNDAPITAGQLEWQWRRQLRQAAPGGLVTVSPPVSRENLLESLAVLKTRFRDEAAFSRELQELGITEQVLLKELARSEMIRDFLEVKFIRNQEATEEEGLAWYRAHADDIRRPARVCASHILKRVSNKDSEAERHRTRQEIEELRGRVLAGEEFADLARKHSDCPSREQGGDLGCFTFAEMVSPFSLAAFALPPGEISGPVVTDDGIHLILAREHQEAGLPPFQQFRTRALQEVRAAKAGPEIKEFLESRRAAAQVVITP